MSTAHINALELTRNSILRINDKKTMLLLREYKNEECLWNTSLEDYPNRSERLRAAEKIAKKLNIKNFEARHVMMKFKNLRNSYCQELKKIAQSLDTFKTNKSAKLYKPRVPWFPLMDSFIRPHLQPSRSSTTTQQQQKKREVTDIKTEFYESDGQEDWSAQTKVNVIPTTTTREVTFINPEPCPSESDEMSNDSRAKRLRRSTSSNPPNEALNQTQPQIFLQNETPNHRNEDTFDNFGKYIASLLRSLPPQNALMLQPKIVNMIVDIGYKDQGSVSTENDKLGDHSETE